MVALVGVGVGVLVLPGLLPLALALEGVVEGVVGAALALPAVPVDVDGAARRSVRVRRVFSSPHYLAPGPGERPTCDGAFGMGKRGNFPLHLVLWLRRGVVHPVGGQPFFVLVGLGACAMGAHVPLVPAALCHCVARM
jgi:hypothetical protein